jgi:Phage tail assembly chaperone protein, TAC
MGFLMGVLGWSPQAAWAATPREVELAITGRLGRRATQMMDGARLNELMADFPD